MYRGMEEAEIEKFDVKKYVATHFPDGKDKGYFNYCIADLIKTLKTKNFIRADPTNYREVCWDLEQRGAVGETILHLCLLNATSTHSDLAKRLLKVYPKLMNDIYLSDDYYGNSLNFRFCNESKV